MPSRKGWYHWIELIGSLAKVVVNDLSGFVQR